MKELEKILEVLHNKSFIRGSLFSVFSFINKGLSFLLLLILANHITPSEYGYLNLFNTVVMVLMYFIAMSAEGYWSVAFFSDGTEGLKKTFSSILLLTVIGTICTVGIIFIGGDWLEDKLSLSTPIMCMAVAICFFTIYNQLLLDNFRIKDKVVVYGLLSCGAALLNFAVSIYLVKYCNLSWQGRVYAQLLCTGLFGLLGFIYFVSNGYITRSFLGYLRPLLLWSIPLIPHSASNFFRQGCDRYIINAYHSIDDVGLFSFALTLSTIITMIGAGFNQSNSVDIYKILGDNTIPNCKKQEMLRKQRRLYTWVYTVCAILIVPLCYLLVPFLLPQYTGSLCYVPLLTIYGYLVCVYFLWTNYLFFFRKTKQIMFVTFGSSILHLVLSLLLTRYSLLLTAALYALTQLIVVVCIKKMANCTLESKLMLE